MSETELIEKAVARVRAAVEQYKPVAIVGLFSGGHDSLTANIVAHEAGADMSLHINTGIGIEQTREFVRDTCDARGWELHEESALDYRMADNTPQPNDYDAFVRKSGFPGPFLHRKMYNRLKERQLHTVERGLGVTSRSPILYITGCRSDESERRMGNTVEVEKIGRRVWVAAIHDFTKLDCTRCIAHCGAKRNPVVDTIHKSGECLCGAFAKKGELAELRCFFPAVAKRIEDLEREVMEKWPWGWEDEGPPDWFRQKQAGQSFMFDYDDAIKSQPLCRKCNIGARDDARFTVTRS